MSISRDLGAYFSSRFQARRFAPLAVFLVLAGSAHSPPPAPLAWLLALVQVSLLVLFFRLWDDIADLDQDRRTHPERILCTTSNLSAFRCLTGSLFAINAVLLLWREAAYLEPVAYATLCVCLLAWYRWRPASASPGLFNSCLLMLKYPAIAWLSAAPATVFDRPLALLCLASAYLIFIAFEILDDDRLARLPAAQAGLVVTVVLLLGVWILIALRNTPASVLPWAALWALIFAATAALGLAAWTRLVRGAAARIGYGFFAVALVAYLLVAAEKSL